MPVTDIKPFFRFLSDSSNKQQPREPRQKTPGEIDRERTRQGASDYLVSLSRKSPRGQAYAKNADSVRSMIGEMKTTTDWKRRRAIVQTLKNKGFIDE
jgi:hypothetical protein